jgi:hypothetical protein
MNPREKIAKSRNSRAGNPRSAFASGDYEWLCGCRLSVMLKIQRSANARIVFSLSGRIEVQDVAELRRLLSLETADRLLALDLKDVTLVDRLAVRFLARCKAESIELENCPAYIREWIERESGRSRRKH